MSSGDTTVQQSTEAPWEPTQGYLTSNLANVASIYSQPEMWQPYDGQTTIPFSDQSLYGLGAAESVADYYMGNMQQPLNAYSSMMNSTQGLAQGNYGGTIYDQSQQLRNSLAPSAFGDFSGDSAFMANLANTQKDTAEQVNLAMSGAGRYGSGQHTDTLATSIMDATNKAKQDYQQMAIDNYRGLTSDLATGQNNAATQLLSYGQAMPDAYQAAIAPADTLMSVGSQYENLQGNYAQEAMDDYYAWQDLAKSNAAEMNALYSGVGQLGGQDTKSVTTPGTSAGEWLGTGLSTASYLGKKGPK